MYQNNRISHQFPQPTRPICFSDGIQFPQPSSSCMFSHEERITTSTAATTSSVSGEEEAVVDELVMILFECLGRVDTELKELLLKKMFTELEKEEELEEFITGRLEHSKVKVIPELLERHRESQVNNTLMRELNVDPTARNDLDRSGEESTQKLERFKVKPIKLSGAGVVK